MGGNSSLATSNSGIENDSSVKHTVGNDQSKSSIEQPVLPKSISQIGGNVRKCILFLEYCNASIYKKNSRCPKAYIVYSYNFQHPIRIQVDFGEVVK